jgi:HK97 gp10 family phage protein
MNINVKIEGLSDVNSAFKKLQKACPEAAKKAITKAALLVEKEAKLRCPVDTGRLRSSITHEITEEFGGNANGALVGTNTEYAPHVEFGTRKQKAQPYLIPALQEAVTRIKTFFEYEFRKL